MAHTKQARALALAVEALRAIADHEVVLSCDLRICVADIGTTANEALEAIDRLLMPST